jgi:hypothetical protein
MSFTKVVFKHLTYVDSDERLCKRGEPIQNISHVLFSSFYRYNYSPMRHFLWFVTFSASNTADIFYYEVSRFPLWPVSFF